MDFNSIKTEIKENILKILDNHLNISITNLEKDKYGILPMLMTIGVKPDSNLLMSLQPKDGNTDVDKALEVALHILKDKEFENALFSYSTKIGCSDGKVTDALKTFIFEKSGLTVVFFTPYKRSGLFKKKVIYEKSIIENIIENIF